MSVASTQLFAQTAWRIAAAAALVIAAAACQPAVLAAEEEGKDAVAAIADSATDVGTVTGQDTPTNVDTATADDGAVVAKDDADTVTPADVAQCPDDAACQAVAKNCELGYCIKGACTFQIAPDATKCDDGNKCTTGEGCAGGQCIGGKPTNCNDDNVCTTDKCVSASGCVHAPLATGACNDGVECTTGDHCDGGTCTGTNICPVKTDADCPQLNACEGPRKIDTSKVPYKCVAKGEGKVCVDNLPNDCTAVTCDPSAGTGVGPNKGECVSKSLAEGAKCEDGIPCTTNETCVTGKCQFDTASNLCGCLNDGECDGKSGENNLCLAKWYCDKSTAKWLCTENLATKVVCDQGSDSFCIKNTCDPASGKCKLTPANEGQGCEDGQKCTTGEVCEIGLCVLSANICGCKINADCAKEEDGDVCNGTLFCNKKTGQCELNPATVVKCPTALDTSCMKTFCNKKSGLCEPTPVEKLKKACPVDEPDCPFFLALVPGDVTPVVACDDGDLCSASSSCKSGQCTTEPTAYSCVCKVDGDCAAKDDGNKCNGTMYCNKSLGKCEINPSTIVFCNTANDTQCEKNVCDIIVGVCKQTIVGTNGSYVPCEDDNFCTKFDDCEAGKCVSGTNTCTCTKDDECVDDGDLCNGILFCNKATGACETNPATVVKCSITFDTACAKNRCNKLSGKCQIVSVSDSLSCDDSNTCTSSDVCLGGECVSGTNLCKCTTNADCAKKEDGNKCNGTLYCDKSTTTFDCKVDPLTPIYCPTSKDSDCTKNMCDPATGTCALKAVPQIYAPCTDNNPCTVADLCLDGKCESGQNLCECASGADCLAKDDEDPCNGTLTCLQVGTLKKCTVNPTTVPDCSGSSECLIKACAPTTGKCMSFTDETKCNDNNPCTSESCENGLCKHANLANDVACGLNKTCKGGQCLLTN